MQFDRDCRHVSDVYTLYTEFPLASKLLDEKNWGQSIDLVLKPLMEYAWTWRVFESGWDEFVENENIFESKNVKRTLAKKQLWSGR